MASPTAGPTTPPAAGPIPPTTTGAPFEPRVIKPYPHPYYPRGLVLDGLRKKDVEVVGDEVLPIYFFLEAFALYVLVWTAAFLWNRSCPRRSPLKLGTFRKLVVLWEMVSGVAFVVMLGYYVAVGGDLRGRQDKLAETWKEYCRGDSRWLVEDDTTWALAHLGALVTGPLALLAAWAYFSHQSSRYVLLLVTSLLQMLHAVVYLLSGHHEQWKHSPFGDKNYEHSLIGPFYFWVYVVYFNSYWIWCPALGILNALWNKLGAGQPAQVDAGKKKQ